MKDVSTSTLTKLAKQASIPREAIARAQENWTNVTEALREGAGSGDPRKLQDRYRKIRRLVDEAERIILEQKPTRDITYCYAIDPHLINGYCTFWNNNNFKAFDFLEGEWHHPEEEQNRTDFIMFMLGAILRMDGLVCLRSGRHEISDLMAYYISISDESSVTEDHRKQFDDALKVIYETQQQDSESGRSKEEISKFIWGQFDALVGAGGIPLMRNGRALYRLVGLLRTGVMKSSFTALHNRTSVDRRESVTLAERYFKAAIEDSALLRDARNSFYIAYSTYVRATRLSSQGLANEEKAKLRRGEIGNLNALFEINLINACLAEAESDTRLRYITDSTLLFSFVSGFDPNALAVELVHPRHVFLFENKPLPENLTRFEQVLTRAGAFVDSVPRDHRITTSDLDQFEVEFGDVLRDVRATYSFASVDTDKGLHSLAAVITNFALNQSKDPVAATSMLSKISHALEATSGKVAREFLNTVDQWTSEGFSAFKRFSDGIEPSAGFNRVLVKAFCQGDQSGTGDSAVPRFVCIPVSGGYRNLFKIYYPPAIKAIQADVDSRSTQRPHAHSGGDIMTVRTILDLVEGVVSEASPVEGRAQLEFTRAIYAMANSHWLLAANLTESALELLEKQGAITEDAGKLQSLREQSMIAQELRLLQHFSRRGIAANLESLPKKQSRLLLAAEDLYLSAEATQSFDDSGSFTTAYNPNSVRQALSAVAFLIEWLALKVAHDAAQLRPHGMGPDTPVLPRASFDSTVWIGLDLAERGLNFYSSDPASGQSLLRDINILVERIEAIHDSLLIKNTTNQHSIEFWRYILLRAIGLRLLLDLLILLNILPAVDENAIDKNLMVRYKTLLSDHDRYVEGAVHDGNGPPVNDTHPFANFVVDSLRYILLERESDDATPLANITRLQALIEVGRFHYELSPNGFPRSVSQAFISKYGRQSARRLQDMAEALIREADFGHIYKSEAPTDTGFPSEATDL